MCTYCGNVPGVAMLSYCSNDVCVAYISQYKRMCGNLFNISWRVTAVAYVAAKASNRHVAA